jgi:hypothetical protein
MNILKYSFMKIQIILYTIRQNRKRIYKSIKNKSLFAFPVFVNLLEYILILHILG